MSIKTKEQAYAEMMDLGDGLKRLLTHAHSSQQPLTLPKEVTDKLSESLQALFAAQRLLETVL